MDTDAVSGEITTTCTDTLVRAGALTSDELDALAHWQYRISSTGPLRSATDTATAAAIAAIDEMRLNDTYVDCCRTAEDAVAAAAEEAEWDGDLKQATLCVTQAILAYLAGDFIDRWHATTLTAGWERVTR